MGNTTIIELDHDFAKEIEERPVDFVEAILRQLRSRDHDGQAIPSGRIVVSFNRTPGLVKRGWGIEEDWERFKAKWMPRKEDE